MFIRLLILFFIGWLFFAILLYFFSIPATNLREKIWNQFLDADIIYLKDGKIIQGWIWNENPHFINGLTKEKDIFAIERSECKKIERNVFLYLLQQLM